MRVRSKLHSISANIDISLIGHLSVATYKSRMNWKGKGASIYRALRGYEDSAGEENAVGNAAVGHQGSQNLMRADWGTTHTAREGLEYFIGYSRIVDVTCRDVTDQGDRRLNVVLVTLDTDMFTNGMVRPQGSISFGDHPKRSPREHCSPTEGSQRVGQAFVSCA